MKNSYEYTRKIKETDQWPSSSDSIIRVKIEWNGKTENLILKKNNNF